MSQSSPPPGIARLVAERAAARRDGDWSRADALRDRLAALGWQVEDLPSGSTARPILGGAAPPSVAPAAPDAEAMTDAAVDRLDDPPTVAASIQVVAEDHPEDFARLLAGLAAHPPATGASWELVVVANAPSFDMGSVLEGASLEVEPRVIEVARRLDWADSRTLGLRRSAGGVTVMVDTSVEPTDDFIAPLVRTFEEDSTVGLAGPWGVVTDDGRTFVEAPVGEVHAIESYCLAIRHEALRAVGGFDRRFRFYRHADLDLSFAVRDAGWRAVRQGELPVARHEHRAWHALAPAERDRLSKRNFYRFLDHWRDRPDLWQSVGTPSCPRAG